MELVRLSSAVLNFLIKSLPFCLVGKNGGTQKGPMDSDSTDPEPENEHAEIRWVHRSSAQLSLFWIPYMHPAVLMRISDDEIITAKSFDLA